MQTINDLKVKIQLVDEIIKRGGHNKSTDLMLKILWFNYMSELVEFEGYRRNW